ncbi:MAG: hypothetical protein R3B36_17615 [Polyangiaceae bacterium]
MGDKSPKAKDKAKKQDAASKNLVEKKKADLKAKEAAARGGAKK